MALKHWTPEEEQYIRDHWQTMTDAEMGAHIGRSPGAVATVRRRLRVGHKVSWLPEEEEYLMDKWGIYNTQRHCFQFSICEDTPMLAMARLFQKIGDDARDWRFEPRQLPHR